MDDLPEGLSLSSLTTKQLRFAKSFYSDEQLIDWEPFPGFKAEEDTHFDKLRLYQYNDQYNFTVEV